jgi:hypothetical protein
LKEGTPDMPSRNRVWQRKVTRSSAPLPRPTTWLLTPRAGSVSGPPKKRGNNELSQLVRILDAIRSDDMHNGEDSNGKISIARIESSPLGYMGGYLVGTPRQRIVD